ncbi:putative 1-phosphatidylinositol 4,5-bisphosphate phosphodiesterase delta-4 [Blattamonas nauphoetae]|uniref:Phosphoinositide phospholipase C n=1 Tax=Blattamonas nauphoetae TaxID=2049346 RepID=A0ABQ9XUC3_9EUKA|nr:putative 1-phosphatidylinositol 4,5-bisphosphate phosphodiesterase delta-4 [Blattamonas nauphoetae]
MTQPSTKSPDLLSESVDGADVVLFTAPIDQSPELRTGIHAIYLNEAARIDGILYLDKDYLAFGTSKTSSPNVSLRLSDITAIRKESITSATLQHQSLFLSQSISVVHGTKTYPFVLDSEDIAELLVQQFTTYFGTKHILFKADDPYSLFLHSLWVEADEDKNNFIALDEIVKLMSTGLKIKVSKSSLKHSFNQLSTSKDGLNEQEFIQFISTLMTPATVMEAFLKANSSDSVFLSEADFRKYVNKKEHTPSPACDSVPHYALPPTTVNEWIAKNVTGKELSAQTFSSFLTSHLNTFNHPQCSGAIPCTIYPLTLPMSYYFINSSHNTYLTSNQLSGASAVEMYANVLRRGVRCVELDIWDGSDEGSGDPEPVVTHGYTLTTQVKLRDVLSVINANAFVSSDLPLVLSLELRIKTQRNKTAEIFREVLGDKIFSMKDNSRQRVARGEAVEPGLEDMFITDVFLPFLPSPDELRGKILLRTDKKAKNAGSGDGFDMVGEDDLEMVESDEEEDIEGEPSEGKKQSPASLSTSTPSVSVSLSTISASSSDAMSEISLFCKGSFPKSFMSSLSVPSQAMVSYTESKIGKITNDPSHRFAALHHTQTHLMRIYPVGTRFNSSNYDPIPAWKCGCQLVALNMQTVDRPLLLNFGLFGGIGGNGGFVLKPPTQLRTIRGDIKTERIIFENTTPSARQAEFETETGLGAIVARPPVCPHPVFASPVLVLIQDSLLRSCGNGITPNALRGKDWVADEAVGKAVDPARPMFKIPIPTKLVVRVLSGFNLPTHSKHKKNTIHNPYVKLRLFSLSPKGDVDPKSKKDEKKKGSVTAADPNTILSSSLFSFSEQKFTTKTIRGNGLNPAWNENASFDLPKLATTLPNSSITPLVTALAFLDELASIYLEIRVCDDITGLDIVVGYSVLCLTGLQEGLRWLPLMNETGTVQKEGMSGLFVRAAFSY